MSRGGPVLGVDVGSVRVGLAVSDPDRVVATPLETIPVDGDVAERIAAHARAHGCDLVVVGLPRALSGRDTESTRAARAVGAALREHGLAVEFWDERFSSTEAERTLVHAGRRREQRRAERDRIAATIILQTWLDGNR